MPEEPFIMIIAVVFIGCAAGVAHSALGVLKGYLDKKLKIEELKAKNSEAALHDVLRQARDEMTQLHHASNDVILTFDSTLQRLDDRIQHLERQSLATESVPQPLPTTAPRLVTPALANRANEVAPVTSALGDGASPDR